MTARAYYNEIEPYAAAWLRNLIGAGRIAPGDVDERDIRDVRPNDLTGYAQCHFFAGLGGWSHALRRAGWADDRPVWTGSCPCQPFSQSGKTEGFADERHLWPAFFHLIEQCAPGRLYGEQVAGPAALDWWDIVSDDLEGAGYAATAIDLGAAGVGAPHIRQRLYWVADALHAERGTIYVGRKNGRDGSDGGRAQAHSESGAPGEIRGMVFPDGERRIERKPGSETARHGRPVVAAGGMADAEREGLAFGVGIGGVCSEPGGAVARETPQRVGMGEPTPGPAGPTNGFWRNADWLRCRDGKWRSARPGTFPLAHGVPARVGRLRAAGNAIVAPLAEIFIRATL